MDAEFTVHSLGVSMLSKGTTGLGVIQKPLREKYFAYLKNGDTTSPPGPEVDVKIDPRGVTLIYSGSNPGQRNEDFYEISSIHFMEAIHFVISKKNEKKLFFAFLPIDEASTKASAKDALFTQLEKKYHSFTKQVHPPLLVCVMRRPTGVKAVDCHMFVTRYAEDALEMATMVNKFQNYPLPAGNYNAGPVREPPQGRYQDPDVIPRDPPYSDKQEYEVYRGREVELRQDHFRQNPNIEQRNSRNSGGYYEANRSFEGDRHSGGYNQPDSRERRPDSEGQWVQDEPRMLREPVDRGRDGYGDRRSIEYRDYSGYKERDSQGQEYAFDNAVSHERSRSGEFSGYNGSDRAGSDRSGGRKQYGGGGGPPPGSVPGARYSGEIRERDRDRAMSPTRFLDNPPPQQQYNRGYPSSTPLSPGTRSPPRARSPPMDDNIYSASNLESRQEDEGSGKPVAKVPPHRHAGIKVLPSLPLAGLKKVQLKPVSPRSPKLSPTIAEKPPKYNLEPEPEPESDEEENLYDNAPYVRPPEMRRDRIQSDKNGGERRVEGNGYQYQDRRPASDSFYGMNKGYSNEPNNRPSGSGNHSRQGSNPTQAAYNAQPWSFDEEKEKFLKQREDRGDYSPHNSREYSDRKGPGSDHSGDGVGKDAEIANMFSNLRTSRGPNENVDFERTLGYLP